MILSQKSASAFANIGYSYLRPGKLDKAVKYSRIAVKLEPRNQPAAVNLTNALRKLKTAQ